MRERYFEMVEAVRMYEEQQAKAVDNGWF
jgi:hypothetical protein